MNLKIKFRESFRPFAPAVLREHASEWFDIEPRHESPYMLLVAPVLEHRRVPVEPSRNACTRSRPAARGSTWSAPRFPPSPTSIIAPGCRPSMRTATLAFIGCSRHSTRTAVRSWSTPASTSAASRSSARRRTPIAASRHRMDALVLEDIVVDKDKIAASWLRRPGGYLAQFQLD